MRSVAVLVEGESDRAALDVLAARRGLSLRVEVMAGVTNVAAHVRTHAAAGTPVAGLYDTGEERFVRRGLERAGIAVAPGPAGLEALGFFGCDADLEDELIRALGAAAVLAVVEAAGELPSFGRFRRMPAQRDRPVEAQLHRFLGTRSGRKIRYGALLAGALGDAAVPPVLDRLLDYVRAGREPTEDR